jgi:energy-coupling factor transporter transmembrane protein EcfT
LGILNKQRKILLAGTALMLLSGLWWRPQYVHDALSKALAGFTLPLNWCFMMNRYDEGPWTALLVLLVVGIAFVVSDRPLTTLVSLYLYLGALFNIGLFVFLMFFFRGFGWKG